MQYLCYAVVFAALSVLRLSDAVTHNTTHAKPQCDGKEKASTLVDVAKEYMNKAKNLYPDCIDDDFQCGRKEKSLAFLEVAANLIGGVKKTFPTCPEPECPTVSEPVCQTVLEPECPTVPDFVRPTVPDFVRPTVPVPECPKVLNEKPMDCSEVLDSGKTTSGVYTIWPRSRTMPEKGISVYCDMDKDGGGWTFIQRRGNFSTPNDYFDKDWNSYKMGFGNLKEEFWLGNDIIHAISNQANYTIRFDLKDAKGVPGCAQYDTFWIEDEKTYYKIRIGGYNGNVGDSMADNNNMMFSTKDRDNEKWQKLGCSSSYTGGWWFNNCTLSNMNGLNQPGVSHLSGISWYLWRYRNCLSEVEIKLKPRNYANTN